MNREKRPLSPQAVGGRIKKIRGSRTLEDFGELLGVKPPTVHQYERDRIPDAQTLAKIAQIGGTTVDWILYGENSGIPEAPDEYGWMTRRQRRLLKIFDNLVKSGDREVLDHLDRQLDLLIELIERRRGGK